MKKSPASLVINRAASKNNFAGVCALAALLAGVVPATAVMADDDMPPLAMALANGSAPFSLESTVANAPSGLLASYPRSGWHAALSTRAHGVRGTATIVDADTFRVDGFFYDGGGIKVHFILAAADDYTAFRDARIVTDLNLLGMPHSGDSITIDLPSGTTFDG